ncbi:MAG: DUF4249 domain-containing protein [Cyclobacteriaceae bacterium]|nr:DUF4249 domain-containing protein [Cyclobacteriaceae bacterium]
MENRKVYFYIILLMILYSNCVEEFEPSRQGYENLLVVDAFLSGGSEPFEVLLSRSVPIDTNTFLPERNANIRLESGSGESHDLFEIKPGVYNSYDLIQGQVGETYRLHINTWDGKQYASDPVVMRETPPMDEVGFDYEKRPWAGVDGVQIYVNTHDPENKTHYYRWEWDETWIFYTPFDSNIIYENGAIVPRTENINTCWKNGKSSSIDIFSTKSLNEDKVAKFPLLFVSNETDRIRWRYSINVRQYSLSEASYNYWKELQKNTENLGTLFDPQPSAVVGNIHNTADDKEVVIGYFDASSVEEQRIFITRSDMPDSGFPNYYNMCTDSVVQRNMIPQMMLYGYMLINEEFMIGFHMSYSSVYRLHVGRHQQKT